MAKREIQEINAGSMADIAFLLLIFFLVSTTMDTDMGIITKLPPMPEEKLQDEKVDVKERNIFVVLVITSYSIHYTKLYEAYRRISCAVHRHHRYRLRW